MMGIMNSIIRKFRIVFSSKSKFVCFLRYEGMNIGSNCDIAKSIVIGDEPWLVTIHNNVRITRNVQLITHDGSIWTLRKMGIVNE